MYLWILISFLSTSALEPQFSNFLLFCIISLGWCILLLLFILAALNLLTPSICLLVGWLLMTKCTTWLGFCRFTLAVARYSFLIWAEMSHTSSAQQRYTTTRYATHYTPRTLHYPTHYNTTTHTHTHIHTLTQHTHIAPAHYTLIFSRRFTNTAKKHSRPFSDTRSGHWTLEYKLQGKYSLFFPVSHPSFFLSSRSLSSSFLLSHPCFFFSFRPPSSLLLFILLSHSLLCTHTLSDSPAENSGDSTLDGKIDVDRPLFPQICSVKVCTLFWHYVLHTCYTRATHTLHADSHYTLTSLSLSNSKLYLPPQPSTVYQEWLHSAGSVPTITIFEWPLLERFTRWPWWYIFPMVSVSVCVCGLIIRACANNGTMYCACVVCDVWCCVCWCVCGLKLELVLQ